jgi:putative DNA primase/helicase
LEGASVLANDTILVLDELGVIEAREAAVALYGLSNGTGKARARRDGSLREPTKWNMITLSSGEVPTETKLAEDRLRKARAGQLVRMLDIPADRGKGFGIFDHGGVGADAAEIAKHLKDTAAAVYGTAGPEFVREIIAEGADEIAQMVQEAIQNFIATNVPLGSDSQIGRAAQRLGLIAAAGELAATFGIVPWEAGEGRRAATWALKEWINQRGGTEPAEENQAIEQIRHFIEAHGESRFQPLDDPDAPRVINRAGWSKGKELDREWLCAPEVWKREICAGLDPKFCAAVLKKRGMLRTQADKLQIVATIDGRSQRVYAVTHAIF